MRKIIPLLATSIFALSACSSEADSAAPSMTAEAPAAKAAAGNAKPILSTEIGDAPAAAINYALEKLATDFNHPSAIAFLPGGEILVAERNAGLTLVKGGTKTAVANMPDIHVKSQAGLHDVVLHPDFAENGLVYFSYSHGDESGNSTRLSRANLVMNQDGSVELRNLENLFDRMPLSETSHHYGGRIAFMADGTLLLTTGEGYRYKDDSVKLDNHFGKVVRLNADGSVPADNPFVATEGAKPEIFTYGHRNPQGLIVTADGTIYEHEHGPKGGDEVNILKAGANYGWPVITYGIDYSGAIISPYSEREGLEQSVVHYLPSIAPSGFTMYEGDLFPEWQGDLFIGALAHKHVRRIDLNADGTFGAQEELFGELDARIRDVRTGPDGALYFVTDNKNGSLYRATPKTP